MHSEDLSSNVKNYHLNTFYLHKIYNFHIISSYAYQNPQTPCPTMDYFLQPGKKVKVLIEMRTGIKNKFNEGMEMSLITLNCWTHHRIDDNNKVLMMKKTYIKLLLSSCL